MSLIDKIIGENGILRNKMLYVCAAAALPLYVALRIWGGEPPRLEKRGCLTLPQVVERELYDEKIFDEKQTVEEHMEILEESLRRGINDFEYNLWKYVQFWYGKKQTDAETGDGMEAYSDIVKGIPGSCTEGSVAFWANMKKIREDPLTGDKFNHYLLLVTYLRTDRAAIAGHCLYLGERIDKKGNKKYFLGGINPFENPLVEYDSIEKAIEGNTDLFRKYAWKGLTDGTETGKKVCVIPNKFCVVDPRDVGVDLVYGDDRLNKPVQGKDARETYAEFRQRKLMEHFKEHAKEYVQPED